MEPVATKPAWPMRLAELAAAALVFAVSLAVAASPLGFLWAISRLDLTPTEFYVSALLGIPCAIVLAGWVLLRANGLYQSVSRSDSRAVLETSITFAVLVVIVATSIWFFSGEGGTHLGP